MTEGRKVAAILVADVVGYSRLTGGDEELTLARLRTLRFESPLALKPHVRREPVELCDMRENHRP